MATIQEAFAVAVGHHQSGRLDEAAILYRRILDADPAQPDAHHLLGVIAAQRGRFDDAIALIGAALAQDGNNPSYLGNMGAALKATGRYDEAERCLSRALVCEPAGADVIANLGASLAAAGRFDDAIRWLARAVALAARHFEAALNLGVALRNHGRMKEAAGAFEAARAIRPDSPHLDCEMAVLSLAVGDLSRGWALFESRKALLGLATTRLGKPQWQGETIAGKTILLHFEQGLGDTVQFIRYAPLLAERGARVITVVQPALARLLRSCRGVAEIIPWGSALPPFDLCCPLMSLPQAFATTLDAIPSGEAYLSPPPELVASWAERLGPRRRPRVGLAWAGNPRPHDPNSNALDRRRSLSFAAMVPVLGVPGIDFVSLQMGDAAVQAGTAIAAGRLRDPMAAVTDYADTAAIMANLDLVISVDTSVVHVAAAIGRPVWMLSRFDGCWRWLRGRDDSPWYPTLRLYRQEEPGAWDPVVARVARDLAAYGG